MAGNGHEPIKDEPSDVAEDAPDAAAAMQQRQQQQPQRQATPSAADDEGAAGAAAAAAAGEGARVRWPYGVNQSGLVRISVCLDDQGRPQADGRAQGTYVCKLRRQGEAAVARDAALAWRQLRCGQPLGAGRERFNYNRSSLQQQKALLS